MTQSFPVSIRLFLLAAAFLVAVAASIHAQDFQYKKISREAMAAIVDGKVDQAIQQFSDFLKTYPDDLESLYGLTVAYSQKGDIDQAMSSMQKAVDKGLPFSRFIAGPRDLLQPLTRSRTFKKYAQQHQVQLLHGPLLGCVTDTGAKFWVRTADEVSFQVSVSPSPFMRNSMRSEPVKTKRERDYTGIASIKNLEPDTQYYYVIYVDGKKINAQWTFRTFPRQGTSAAFQIGFGGGAGYTPKYERMWNTIWSHSPIAFLLLGDNVYIDNPTRPAVQQYCYYRRQSRPEFRHFSAQSSIYAIWDDHDFTTNDAWGGPEIDTPAWKRPVWHLFMNNWNNPAYGGGEKQPGCWFQFSIGDVDFFMLDGRYYRTDPKVDNPDMLGAAQKQWLFDALKKSKGTFKIIASPVPWSYGAKPGSLDPWQGYKKEREMIFSFLEDNRIEGVVLLSADRHRSDAWKIEREKGYNLYEFESSKISNIHTHKLMPGAMFGYNDTCSFGLLTFDTTKTDPTVSYEIYSIDNALIHKITLKHSQLAYKK